MPYESPNIVIVPTMSSVNTKKPSTSTSDKTTSISENMFEPTPNIAPKVTNTPQEASKLTNQPQSEINKLSMEKDVTLNQGTISKQVPQSDAGSKYSASSEDPKNSKKTRSPTNSWASNYLQSIGQSASAKPVKVDLLSTSNDIYKQTVNNTDKKKCDQEIKINLLPRPKVSKNTDKKAGPPLLTTPNFSSSVRTEISMNTTWTSRSQLETPPNQNIHYRPHMDTIWTCPSQLENPTNQTIYCSPHTTGTCPPVLQIPTNPSFGFGPCMGTTCTCSSLLQNSTNLSMRPYNDMTWTNPPLLETTPIASQIPTPLNLHTSYTPYMDPKTWLTQYPYTTNTVHQPNEAINFNNPTVSLVREPETIYTKTTSQDTLRSNFKSLMDYTWLTRAHYANINQPNKNLNKNKPANKSQNTQKRVEETRTNSLAKDFIKPTLVIKDKINKTDRKQYSNKELLNSETNAKKLDCVQKNAGLKTNKEIREKERCNIKKAIQTLETKIRKLTSNQKLYKIPKLSDSKKDYVKRKAETNSKTQSKKITPKSDKEEKRTPKKRTHSPDQTNKKRARHNLENDEDSISKITKPKHSNSSELDQRRSSGTEIKSHPKSNNKEIFINEQKEKNRLGLNIKDKNKTRSEKVEAHSSEILQQKRKRRDSSCESMPKKLKEISPIKGVVTSKKSHLKHPRIQPPDSDYSDDDLGNDFDLRSKLSRDNHKRYIKHQLPHKAQFNDKVETPRENLMITINQNNDADQTTVSLQPGPSIPKQKLKKYKKIRLVINVIQEDTSDDSSSDASKDTITSPKGLTEENVTKQNLDISFLDDFNVDEIVNSLKHNPKLDSVQQNIKRKVENTKTSAVSTSNTFVQPIIIKKEIKTEQHSEIQSNITYSRETSPDNVTNSKPVKDMFEQSSEKNLNEDSVITNAVFVDNIKQEMHEDYTEEVYNPNTDMAYLQKSLDEDLFQTVNQSIGMVVENTKALIDKPGVVELLTDIKREPCENYNDNVFDQDNEPQDLLITDKKYNIENKDTQVLTDFNEKQNKSFEFYHSSKFSAKICDKTNHDKVQEIDEKVRAENNNNIILGREVVNNIILEEQDANLIEPKKTELEGKTSKDKSSANTMVTSDVPIKDKYEVNISSGVVKTINSEHNVNMIKEIQPEVEDKTSENKPSANTLGTTDVTIEEDSNVKMSSETVKTIKLENNVNVTKTIQPEVKDQLEINTSAISDVTIEDNNEVKITSEVIKSTKLVNDEYVTEKIQPEVKDQLDINNSAISDVTIDDNNEVKNSSEVVKTTKLDNDVNVTETIQPEIKNKLGPNTSAIFEIDPTIKDNYEVKISSDVVNSTVKQKVQEKAPEDKPVNTASAKSDVTTEDKNNELSENKEILNNASVSARTVTIVHPSLKSNKVLAVRLEERIFDYLNLKVNVVSLIRQGKFAKVFQCKDTNGQNYALKILINEQDRNRLGLEKEKLLKELQSDIPKENLNIVYFINGFGLDRKWCFLMDYYPVSLRQALARTRFDMDTVQELAKQLVAAVLVMRSNNIVHSDIRPGHILLDSGYKTLKVCGFDAAYYAADNVKVVPNIGTVHYRAPEIILGYSAGFSIDVWATALVMYEMVAGRKLFDSKINYNNNILFNQISLCGQIPMDMVLNSRYSRCHFVGTAFKRITGPRGQHVLFDMNRFEEKHNMFHVLLSACHQKWSTFRGKSMRATDRVKLSKMSRLLDKMLVLDPNRRLPIEFVYADSFFTYKSM